MKVPAPVAVSSNGTVTTRGVSGSTGVSAPTGVSGMSGVSGASGATGISGKTGVTGVSGKSGVTGKTAPTGPVVPPPTSFWRPESEVIRPTLHSIGLKGQVVVLNKIPASSRWIWKGSPAIPTVRTWVTLKEGVEIQSVETSTAGALIVEEAKKKEFLPDGFKIIPGRTLVFDSLVAETHLKVTLKKASPKEVPLKKGEKKKPAQPTALPAAGAAVPGGEVLSIVQQLPIQGLQWVHQSCDQLGFLVSPEFKTDQFQYIAARCDNRGGKTGVTLFFSSELQPKSVESSEEKKEVKEIKSGSDLAFTFKTDPKEKKHRMVGRMTFVPAAMPGSKEGKPMVWRLFSGQPPSLEKRFTLGGNLGFTFFNYVEPSQGLHTLGLNLTFKLNSSIALVREKLFLDIGGFVTLVPIFQLPSSIYRAWYYGLNTRLGYVFAIKNVGLGVHVGFYMWGMIVPTASYGLTFALGPQLFLTLRSRIRKTDMLYVKAAPLGGGVLTNFEFAVGGQVGVSPKTWKRPLSLSLDVADFKYDSSDLVNRVHLTTISMGLSMPLTKP